MSKEKTARPMKFTVMLTEEERASLAAIAKDRHLSMAQVVRAWIRGELWQGAARG